MHRTVLSILMLTSALALIPACDDEPLTCGIYVYDPELDTCVCPAGSPLLADGTCGDAGPAQPDGANDAGSETAIDACTERRFYRDRDEDGAGDATDILDACEAPDGYVDNAGDCDDECPTCHPGGVEVCEGTHDEDCVDGVDDGCTCAVGATRACPGGTDAGECTSGTQTCTPEGVWSSCVGAVAPATEVCNGRDDDCDTITDGPSASLACGTAPRATTVGCSGGSCIISACVAGYADCDPSFSNGCETTLGTLAHCGSCTDSCGWDCEGTCNDAVAVHAGFSHACTVRDAGDVVCWGSNSHGQVGTGTLSEAVIFPVQVSGLPSRVTRLATGTRHTCALMDSGAVWCWGDNDDGELGDGTTAGRARPAAVSGLGGGVISVVAGQHTCALTDSGGVRCWGRNAVGQVGDGTTTSRTTPVGVSGLASGVVALAAGQSHTCALLSSGTVRCWGSNGSGRLGDGTTTARHTPVDVSGLTGVVAIGAGDDFTCALLASGSVRCWGDNTLGQLGDGSYLGEARTTPVMVEDLVGVDAIAVGSTHACVLASGGVRCWGHDTAGQLGDGGAIDEGGGWPVVGAPVEVVGLASGVAQVTAGSAHTCAVLSNGGVRCWGSNRYGQLGDGTMIGQTEPTAVAAP
jgi:alpha-tubulin suppressor-like RCC1 family protein